MVTFWLLAPMPYRSKTQKKKKEKAGYYKRFSIVVDVVAIFEKEKGGKFSSLDIIFIRCHHNFFSVKMDIESCLPFLYPCQYINIYLMFSETRQLLRKKESRCLSFHIQMGLYSYWFLSHPFRTIHHGKNSYRLHDDDNSCIAIYI